MAKVQEKNSLFLQGFFKNIALFSRRSYTFYRFEYTKIDSCKGEKNVIKKAIIPAAGYGTRSLPITKVLPKEMFPVGVKPAIQYVVEEAIESGIEDILIIVSRTKSMIVDYFDYSLELEAFLEKENKKHLLDQYSIPSIQIHYTRQPYAKGLGDAVHLGKTFVGNEPFAVLLPDDLILPIENEVPGLKQLINEYMIHHCPIIGLNEIDLDSLKNYGVIGGTEVSKHTYKINHIIEKPKVNPPSNLAVIGRYIFTPTIFNYLESTLPDQRGEVQLTDAIKKMLNDYPVKGRIISGRRFDIGIQEDYLKLINHIFLKDKKQ